MLVEVWYIHAGDLIRRDRNDWWAKTLQKWEGIEVASAEYHMIDICLCVVVGEVDSAIQVVKTCYFWEERM